jgi:N-acetyl-anhydromuramyl-L-alanine amidase AmpD
MMVEKVGLKWLAARMIASVFLLLSGCTLENGPTPVITNPGVLRPPIKSPQRAKWTPSQPRQNNKLSVSRDWIPPAAVERKWTAIIVHHSYTGTGNAAAFDRYHRETKGWDGVSYDFVIGNGNGSGDGQVEVTFRWRKQVPGAHTKTATNWANEEAVGICLVGDFEYQRPTAQQMRSLVKLIKFLQSRYRIPTSRIYAHKDTPGARATECPGRNFSVAQLKAQVSAWTAAR